MRTSTEAPVEEISVSSVNVDMYNITNHNAMVFDTNYGFLAESPLSQISDTVNYIHDSGIDWLHKAINIIHRHGCGKL